MDYPSELKYNKEHLWFKFEGKTVTIGITDFAQDQLGDLLFVELPEEGDAFTQGEEFSVVESSKQASSLIAPFGFKVLESNEKLDEEPEYINEKPYDGWIVKAEVTDEEGMDSLVDVAEYENSLE
ncbi:MAG: glycine cleavage system protein GcvH [Eubacteriales bacterium]